MLDLLEATDGYSPVDDWTPSWIQTRERVDGGLGGGSRPPTGVARLPRSPISYADVGALRPSSPEHPFAPADPAIGRTMARWFGLDRGTVGHLARAGGDGRGRNDRARKRDIAAALDIAHVLTDRGTHRADRLGRCGALMPARAVLGRARDPAVGPAAVLYGMAPRHCRDRMCPSCQRSHARKLGRELGEVVEEVKREWTAVLDGALGRGISRDAAKRDCTSLLFLTVTQRKRHIAREPLAGAVERLQAAWERLRKRKAWKGMVVGGARAIEVTWSPEGEVHHSLSDGSKHTVEYDGWHAHIHAVVELAAGVSRSAFLAMFREHWSEGGIDGRGRAFRPCADAVVTKGAVVRLDPARVAQVCKYVSKPLQKSYDGHESRLVELAQALDRKRMFNTFGGWHSAGVVKAAKERLDAREESDAGGLMPAIQLGDETLSELVHRDAGAAEFWATDYSGGAPQTRLVDSVPLVELASNCKAVRGFLLRDLLEVRLRGPGEYSQAFRRRLWRRVKRKDRKHPIFAIVPWDVAVDSTKAHAEREGLALNAVGLG